MNNSAHHDAGIITLRHAAGHWFFLNLQYELEDALVEVAGGSLLRVEELERQGTRRGWLRHNRVVFPVSVDKLFIVAMSPARCWLDRFEGWRKQCGDVTAYLFDAWPVESVLQEIIRGPLNDVDVLYVSFPEAVDFYAGKIKPEVRYLPQGFDQRWFRPGPGDRSIYCTALARQDENFLRGAIDWCEARDRLLLRSTDSGAFRRDWMDVQTNYAAMLRHSRYSLCWSNRDRKDWSEKCGIDPVTARHFHILATGAIYVGTPPECVEWKRFFPEDPCVDVRDFGGDTGKVFAYLDENYGELAGRAADLAKALQAKHSWHARASEMADMRDNNG